MENATTGAKHIHNLRALLMRTMAMYAAAHEETVSDSSLVGALAACLCDALIIKGAEFDEEVIESIRKTYNVCQLQRAMQEKMDETVQ